ETIETELALADLDTAERALERATKMSKAGDKQMLARKMVCDKVVAHLGEGSPARRLEVSSEQSEILHDLHLLTAKPVLYIANVAEDGFTNNPLLDQVVRYAGESGAEVVAVSAAIEAEIAQLSAQEKQEFLQELGLEEPGLDRVIRAGYRLLGLETFFTAGPKEVRAWTVRAGSTAPQAAGRIHTDFQRGFIKADVIAFDDYVRLGGESGAREAGKLRQEGKEYIVKDGDVIHFKFNV
ncbi:MAG: DUF933 domain-containing protein, partial [Pseudomonadota bacterium]|nr:DUF933 domain-containing protein [Pseudomonadota bacterium]